VSSLLVVMPQEERIAAEKQAELDRQNAASHVIYRA